METTDRLTTSAYWEEPEPDLRLNPVESETRQGLIEFVRAERGLEGHVLIATSGSGGEPKFAAISKEALLASAVQVNKHLGVSSCDRWVCAIPAFHVGGLGIYARAYLGGNPIVEFRDRWRGRAGEFVKVCRTERITMVSLTPAQVHDLVEEGRPCPETVRAVVVGGGGLEEEIRKRGETLGWPLLQSFGMTEAASQIATRVPGSAFDPWLPVIAEWEVRTDPEGQLAIRGPALFSGYITGSESTGWAFERSCIDLEGWFLTSDLVDLRTEGQTSVLRFKGRADDQLKILGELVSLEDVRRRFANHFPEFAGKSGTAVVAVPDPRKGHLLLGVIECGAIDGELERRFHDFQRESDPLLRPDSLHAVSEFPRSSLGKIRLRELGRMFQ